MLVAEGFLAGIETAGEGYKKKLDLALRYSPTREPVIAGYRAREPTQHPALRGRQDDAAGFRGGWGSKWSRRRSA